MRTLVTVQRWDREKHMLTTRNLRKYYFSKGSIPLSMSFRRPAFGFARFLQLIFGASDVKLLICWRRSLVDSIVESTLSVGPFVRPVLRGPFFVVVALRYYAPRSVQSRSVAPSLCLEAPSLHSSPLLLSQSRICPALRPRIT